MDAEVTILREYLGGSEKQTFEDFAKWTIQDNITAIEIVETMIETDGEYTYNDDEPEFYERFTILSGMNSVLRAQIDEAKSEAQK